MLATYRLLFEMFDRSEQRQFYRFLALITVMALFDLIGVAAVLPFLAVAANPEVVHEHAVLSALYEASGVTTDRGFLVLLGALVLAFILGGMAVKVFGQYRIILFARGRNHSFSRNRLARYLGQPYAWHLNHNSATLGAAILTECDRVVGNALMPALRLLANAVSLLCLIGLLMFISPGVALSAAIGIGGSYALVFFFVRRRLSRDGERLAEANAARYKVAQEAFGGIKDVKLLGLERHYVDRYDKHTFTFVAIHATNQIIAELPRFVLEAVAFCGLVFVILGLLVAREERLVDVLPVLGTFGFALLKVFPSIQQLYNALTQIRSTLPVLTKLHAELTEPVVRPAISPAPVDAMRLSKELTLEDVKFGYPAAGRAAVKGLQMSINANTIVGLVGGTGSGKTTTVDLVLGLLSPDSGRILVDGVPLGPQNLRSWQNTIGYVPQQIFLSDDSVAANIAFGLPKEARDMVAIERAARLAEIHDFVTNELPKGYDTEVGERGVRLSGGQRQRIGIARALYHDPSVLVLDEATSALDNLTERAVMDAVANVAHAKTIIMVAHRLTTVRSCDNIFLLEAGRVVAKGTYDQLVEDNETFRRMAG
jgi:ABC-type multidrug transport system fused ATPase/permease subunit